MKKSIINISILLLVFSLFTTSCQKEEITNAETTEVKIEEIEQIEEFTSLLYNNQTFSKEEIYESEALSSLLNKPYYNLEDKTNNEQEVLRFVFDSDAEADKYFESGELEENLFERGINVRIAIELFDFINFNKKIHGNIVYLNNFNFLYNFTLPSWAANRATSLRVRVNGLPANRDAGVEFFQSRYQQDSVNIIFSSQEDNGKLRSLSDLREGLFLNNNIESYRIYLEESSF